MSSTTRNRLIAIALIAVGAAFLVVGILGGQFDEVFRKASRICLECIGIG